MRNRGIDTEAAKNLGIIVTGAPGKGRISPPSTALSAQKTLTQKTGKARKGPDSTTQHTVALILAIVRNISDDDSNVKSGLWQTSLAMGLSGKVFGTVGLGNLGSKVAKFMYESFGMKVI